MREIPEGWLFPPDLKTATVVQRELSERVIVRDDFGKIGRIGGVDASNNLYDPQNLIYATIVVLNADNLQVVSKTGVKEVARFPYQPGFLAFREVPALVNAFEKLAIKPDLILVDGHGISHPRRMGIASHLGVVLDIPTIGVAKKILVGRQEGELSPEAGSTAPLLWKDTLIGTVLRTRNNTNPVYVSPGHRISHESAVAVVKRCMTGYKLPEPTRQAHLAANQYRKDFDAADAEAHATPEPLRLPL